MKIHMERLTFRDEQGNAHTKRGSSFYGIIEKLAHYEELEEQGLLLKLPCNVGDTVYELQEVRERIQPLEIISVNIGRMGLLYFNWELKDGIGFYQNVKGFGVSQLGKDVFLTEQEAQAALEKMKDETLL